MSASFYLLIALGIGGFLATLTLVIALCCAAARADRRQEALTAIRERRRLG